MNQTEELVLSKEGDRYLYNRSFSPENEKLRQLLISKYGKNCVITSSGLNAISNLLHGIMIIHHQSEPFNLIYGNELYCDTPRLFKYFKQIYKNVNLREVDIKKPEEITTLLDQYKSQNNILFVESCSNPNGFVFDFSIIPKLRSWSQKLYVIVDNTWLTDIVFNPFDYHVDFVIVSLTKYYSGGVAIGGAIISNHVILNDIIDHMRIMGQHISPYHCHLIYDGTLKMNERIIKSSQLTKKIALYLQEHKKIYGVSYPLDEKHISYSLVQKYFKKHEEELLGPSVLTFKVKSSKNKILKAFESSQIIDHKTSFGSKMTRTDPWPYKENEFVVCRLAIGYDDTYERIIQGLDGILNQIG
jgi:cystathionine beta-lyase/cystathionine gamma-synthase